MRKSLLICLFLLTLLAQSCAASLFRKLAQSRDEKDGKSYESCSLSNNLLMKQKVYPSESSGMLMGFGVDALAFIGLSSLNPYGGLGYAFLGAVPLLYYRNAPEKLGEVPFWGGVDDKLCNPPKENYYFSESKVPNRLEKEKTAEEICKSSQSEFLEKSIMKYYGDLKLSSEVISKKISGLELSSSVRILKSYKTTLPENVSCSYVFNFPGGDTEFQNFLSKN